MACTTNGCHQAVNIQDSGVVVGSVKPGRHAMAATWADGTLTMLADPGIEGFPHVTATASNAAGVIVGTASKFEGNSGFGGAAVAWRSGTPVNLNTLVTLPEGVTLQDARDINAAGQIVGTARTATGTLGYVLTPKQTQSAPSPTPTPAPSPSATPSPTASATPTVTPNPSTSPTATPTATPSATTRPRPGLPSTGR